MASDAANSRSSRPTAPAPEADAATPGAAPRDSRRTAPPAPVGTGGSADRPATPAPSAGTSADIEQRAGRRTVRSAVRRRPWLALALAVALDLGLCGAGAAVGGYELLAAQHQLRGAGSSRLAAE